MFVDIAIICPQEVEFREISKLLLSKKSVTSINKRLPFAFGEFLGDHFNWQVAVVEPNDNADSFALWTKEVIDELQPDYLILAGVAGGLKDVKIGDIVIGTSSCNYEYGKETEDGFAPRLNNRNNENEDLLNLAKRIARTLLDNQEQMKYYSGQIVSGSKVIAEISSETYKNIRQHYSSALAVEMEANDFAISASREHTPYINIRGISDMVQNKKQADDKGTQELASARVRDFLKILIKALPQREEEKAISYKVNIIDKSYGAISIRNSRIAQFKIGSKFLMLIDGDIKMIIRQLEKISHVAMPGDFAKNWIEMTFLDNLERKVIYLSIPKALNIGGWVGGGKQLFQRLVKFHQKQIQVALH